MTTRICKICGKKYKVCPSCEGVRTFTPWRTITCDPQEFMLFELLSKHTFDHDSVEAVKQMNTLRFSKERIKTFLPEIQEQISDIQKDAKKSKPKTTQMIEETQVEE